MNVKIVKTLLSDKSPVFDVHLVLQSKVLVLSCEDENHADRLAHELLLVVNLAVEAA
jgi:hypothetical protein